MPTKKPKTLDAKLDDLAESPLNPRRTFRESEVRELADSLAAEGVLQTLLVRPSRLVNGRVMAGAYEVICGARRLRAAHLAGLKTVPVRVRFDLDDDGDALEAMIAENSQRADVPPLEEADAYVALVERGRDVASIAAKLGRSESYVRHRLRLHALGARARVVLERELVPLAGALILAQLDHVAQEKAIAELSTWCRWPRNAHEDDADWTLAEAASVGRVRDVARDYRRRLALATWELDDEDLLDDVGACRTCPSRTAAQVDLFGEDEEDTCLDAGCWERKGDAVWERAAVAAEEAGHEVRERGADKAFGYGGDLVDLAGRPPVWADSTDEPPTWGELLEGAELPRVVLRSRSGVVQAVRRAEAWAAIADRYPKSAAKYLAEQDRRGAGTAGQAHDWQAEEKKRQEKQKIDAEAQRRCLAALAEVASADPDEEAIVRLIRVAGGSMWTNVLDPLLERRGAEGSGTKGLDRLVENTDGVPGLWGLLVELLVADELGRYGGPLRKRHPVRELLDAYGVDVTKHRREARAALTPKKRASKKTASAGAVS